MEVTKEETTEESTEELTGWMVRPLQSDPPALLDPLLIIGDDDMQFIDNSTEFGRGELRVEQWIMTQTIFHWSENRADWDEACEAYYEGRRRRIIANRRGVS